MRQEGASRSFAKKLDHLFQVAPRPGGGRYSMEQVAAAINKEGAHVSASALSRLRSGGRSNPSMKTIETIARFFGVPVMYFFDDAVVAQVDRQFELIEKIDKLGAAADKLSPGARSEIAALIEEARVAARRAFGSDDAPGGRAPGA